MENNEIVHADWCISGDGKGPCNCGAELQAQGFTLSQDERLVIGILGQAWNAYLALPVIHQSDQGEFMQAIHASENVVCSRPAVRQLLYARMQTEHEEQAMREQVEKLAMLEMAEGSVNGTPN